MVRSVGPEEERDLLEALRRRNEAAFAELVRRYAGPMVRLARMYARSPSVAEEIVQETWLGVLRGIDRFEARSSFKTWLFRILVNRARTRAEREARTIPFSAAGIGGLEDPDPAVPAARFRPVGDQVAPFHWGAPPRSWGASPEDQLLSRETLEVVTGAIAALPPAQREVVTLRDVEGWTAAEVCNVLEISDSNQRVLLHRGRSRVRAALERHLDPG